MVRPDRTPRRLAERKDGMSNNIAVLIDILLTWALEKLG
jgi:hypothetical protein